jgi:hypothetical protein
MGRLARGQSTAPGYVLARSGEQSRAALKGWPAAPTPSTVKTLSKLGLDDLRAERHRLSEEVARLAWLRRLVAARCDLEVARLVGVAPVAGELPDAVREALVRHTPALSLDVLQQLAACVRSLGGAVDDTQRRLDEATRELVARYSQHPAGCLPVPPVTGQR